MAAEVNSTVEVQLLQFVSDAFDELADAQKDLQFKVKSTIEARLKESCRFSRQTQSHSHSFALMRDDVSKPSAVHHHLPVPVQSGFTWEKDVDLDILIKEEALSNCNGIKSGTAHVGAEDAPVALPTMAARPALPQLETPPCQPIQPDVSDCDDIEVTMVKLTTNGDGSEHDGSSSGSQGSYVVRMATIPRFSMESSSSFYIYLSTKGAFIRGYRFSELPPWIRFAEQILGSDGSRTCRLHPFWFNHLLGESDGGGASCVVEAYKKVNYALKLEKAFRRTATNFMLAQGQASHRRNSLRVTTTSLVKLACRRLVRSIRKTKSPFPIHPTSSPRLFWDTVCVAICLYDMILLPMASFEFDEDAEAVKDNLELTSAMFWTLDIFLSFGTAYFDGYVIQRNKRKIAYSYTRSWFLVDSTIVANDWVSVLASKGSFGVFRFAKLLKSVLRAFRLIRLKKISSHYLMALEMINSEIALSLIKVATHTLIVAIFSHYLACGWYAMREVEGVAENWVEVYMSPDDTTAYRYCTSLHWSLTQILPASITIQPVNLPERIYNVIVIIVAMVVFSSFVSSITVSMNHLRSCRFAAIERESQLRRFLAQHDISHDVSHTIWSFMKKSLRNSRNFNISPSEVLALKDLPEHILERLYEDAFLKQLRTHPFFDFYSMIEPKCVSKLCRAGVEQMMLPSWEVLWHDLEVNRMLFVKHGALIYKEKALSLELSVGPGEWCCEEALWAVKPRIEVPFAAGIAGCEMLMVNPDVFRDVSRAFPEDSNSVFFLAKYGEEFARRFNQASHDFQYSNVLFNDKHIFLSSLNDVIRISSPTSLYSTETERY